MVGQNNGAVHLLHVVKKTEITESVLDYMKSEKLKETNRNIGRNEETHAVLLT